MKHDWAAKLFVAYVVINLRNWVRKLKSFSSQKKKKAESPRTATMNSSPDRASHPKQQSQLNYDLGWTRPCNIRRRIVLIIVISCCRPIVCTSYRAYRRCTFCGRTDPLQKCT